MSCARSIAQRRPRSARWTPRSRHFVSPDAAGSICSTCRARRRLPRCGARDEGLSVTAEVTPHHLAELPDALLDGVPAPLRKVNPPLRTAADRAALRAALHDGVITAIATDHAPHAASSKADSAAAAA